MMRWLAFVLAVGGCGFEVTITAGDGATQADADLSSCPAAPTGCTAFACSTTRSCYYYCASSQRSTDAQARCAMIAGNGCLVTLDDADEDVCVRTNAGSGDLIHIGLIQPSGSQEPDGGWTWRCGTSTLAAQWTGDEPNDGSGGEDCGTTDPNGGWVDVGCYERFRFVCEVPR